MSTRFVSLLHRLNAAVSLSLPILFAGSASVHSWAQTSPDPDSPLTFRARVNSVLVDVLVLDEDRRPVPALSAEDFTVLEDGVPQEVQMFYVSARDGLESGDPASPNRYPRKFIFIYNRQASSFDQLARAKTALQAFVAESMAEGDEAMVIDNGNTTKITQQFRNSKALTLESIRSLSQAPPVGSQLGRGIFQRLEELGEGLEPFSGRKVAVLMSNEVMSYHANGDMTYRAGGRRWSRGGPRLWRAIESMNQANTSVYTIDLRGPRRGELRPGEFSGLSGLASGTGGRHFRNSFGFENMLRAIGRENSRTYYLGYTPTNDALDGSYRTLEVRVDRPGVQVVARHGYFAKTKDDVVGVDATHGFDNLDSSTPTPRIEPRMADAVEATHHLLWPGNGYAHVPMSVALPGELLSDEPRRLTLSVHRDGVVVQSTSFHVHTRRHYATQNVSLKPGSYEFRFQLEDDGERIYDGTSEFEVPQDFNERFGFSSIIPVVSSDAASGIGAKVPVLPSTTLSVGDDSYLLFQVFPGTKWRRPKQVLLTYTVRDSSGEEVATGGIDEPVALSGKKGHGTPVLLRIPMARLPAGRYGIELHAWEPGRGRRASDGIELQIR